MNNEKTNYSVARVETYTKVSIIKAERHNERKNSSYANMNIDLTQTPNNVHYKRCETTYNERLKELVNNGQVSLRGLKDNAKIYDELVFDINSNYFEKHGGYKFAKEFYEKAFHFAEIEMGADNIISAVMHADELNIALTEEYNKPIYHYHLHVVALPIVKKEIKWSKRCKDKSLIGNVKEIVNQVSHSKKWRSEQLVDNFGKPVYDENGKAVLVKLYSLLQDRFFKYMSDCGYKDFIRGEKGSNAEHLDNLQFKISKDKERLENLNKETDKYEEMINYQEIQISEQEKTLNNLDNEIKETLKYKSTIDNIETVR